MLPAAYSERRASRGKILPWWEDLEDPRIGNVTLHDFHMCGTGERRERHRHGGFAKAKEPFLRGSLKLIHGVPSHGTFSRLFRLLNPEQFAAVFRRFTAAFAEVCQRVVAIDQGLESNFTVVSQ